MPLFGLFHLGTPEIIIILVVGVMLFGSRLPEIGRYLGKGIVEFKKGVRGVEDDVDTPPQKA
jgi:sec-independent protein translocase protein TatA